jgi:hypothetical protein
METELSIGAAWIPEDIGRTGEISLVLHTFACRLHGTGFANNAS